MARFKHQGRGSGRGTDVRNSEEFVERTMRWRSTVKHTKLVNKKHVSQHALSLLASYAPLPCRTDHARCTRSASLSLSLSTLHTAIPIHRPHRVLLFSRSYLVRATVVGTQLPPNKPLSLAISTHHNLREHVEVFFDDNLFLWRASLLLLLLALEHPARCRRDACLVLPTEEHNLRGQVVT